MTGLEGGKTIGCGIGMSCPRIFAITPAGKVSIHRCQAQVVQIISYGLEKQVVVGNIDVRWKQSIPHRRSVETGAPAMEKPSITCSRIHGATHEKC